MSDLRLISGTSAPESTDLGVTAAPLCTGHTYSWAELKAEPFPCKSEWSTFAGSTNAYRLRKKLTAELGH
jgi:hypothetical protein